MSRLSVPVQSQIVFATGDLKLWAEIDLRLKDSSGGFHRETFLIDTGSEITVFPAFHARRLALPVPASPSPGVSHSSGLEVRSGILQVSIEGMDPADVHAVSCLFLGDPAVAPTTGATFPRNLLQPFQLLDRLRFSVDKDPTGSLYGDLLIEKK